MTASATASHATPEIGHLPPQWHPTSATPRLPFGVAVISFIVGVSGLVLVLAGVLYLANYYTMGYLGPSLEIVHAVTAFGAALILLLGAILLVLATSLWRQEAWALYTTVVILFGGLAFLFFTNSITYLFLVLIVLFVYLLAVRHHFY